MWKYEVYFFFYWTLCTYEQQQCLETFYLSLSCKYSRICIYVYISISIILLSMYVFIMIIGSGDLVGLEMLLNRNICKL